MTVSEIEALEDRPLDVAVAQAMGYTVEERKEEICEDFDDTPTGKYETFYVLRNPEGVCVCTGPNEATVWYGSSWGISTRGVPHFSTDPVQWHAVILDGTEQFGGFTALADMETWAAGGLFRVQFFDFPQTYWAPMGLAVCRAYLLAVATIEAEKAGTR